MNHDEPALLILSGVQGDPRRYRTFHLYEQARLAGLNCQLSHVTDPELRKKAKQSSVAILHRAPFDDQIAWLETEIHRKGGILIMDFDDLVFDAEAAKYIHSPDFADPVRRSLYMEDIQLIRKSLDLCDAVITSGEFLAERVNQLGKTALIHRNAFSMEMLALSEAAYLSRKVEPRKIVIGYASGTPTHDRDFTSIRAALQSILIRYRSVELRLVGRLDPGDDWTSLERRIKMIRFVPWRELPCIQAQFDINLAPLQVDNPFGQSKSEIKYVEAGLLRVPTIASPSDAFKYAIRHGENGLLASEGPEWEQLLENLVENQESRVSIGLNAYQYVLQGYHPRVRARQLVDTLNSITGQKLIFHYQESDMDLSSEKTPHRYWSSFEFEKTPTLLQRGIYTLKYRNIGTLVKQIWIYFRRMVSPIFPYRNPL